MIAIDADSLLLALDAGPPLELALLFGSAAQARLRPDSDLDIAVLAQAPLTVDEKSALIESLGRRFGRPVDVVDLAVAGEPLVSQVLATGRRLLGSDEAYAAVLVRSLADRVDFLPYQRRILDERRRLWIGR